MTRAPAPRLDHPGTVLAGSAAGMEVVDSIVESHLIVRVDVLEPTAGESRR